jgi:protein-L-isoaspartate(D-aspartate) O-methyltransferase
MVRDQIEARGIRDPRVLAALRKVDRARFLPPSVLDQAYEDRALPVGHSQTISQPYIVGLMTEELCLDADCTVLEIGTGTGYQTAILAELAREVWSVEVIPELSAEAGARLAFMGYRNLHLEVRDGWHGLAESAPFDRIIVTAAPECVPDEPLRQLTVGGRMVVPVGVGEQDLIVVERTGPEDFARRSVAPVRFVPMVHRDAPPS